MPSIEQVKSMFTLLLLSAGLLSGQTLDAPSVPEEPANTIHRMIRALETAPLADLIEPGACFPRKGFTETLAEL